MQRSVWPAGGRWTQSYTLCPARRTASTTMCRPRIMGGWGPTTPSFHKTPSFSGNPESFEGSARERYSSTISWRKDIGTTAGSLSQGLVDRMERRISSSPPREVLRKPTVERYVFWPGLVFAICRYETLSGVGLREKIPLKAAGIRTEPPISVPTPSVLPRSACRAPSPPDEPPHERFWLLGFSVCPMMLFFVSPKRRVWGKLVLQYSTAPNDKSSVVIWLSTSCAWLGSLMPILLPIQPIYPIVVSLPFTWNWSFKLTGRPCSGPMVVFFSAK